MNSNNTNPFIYLKGVNQKSLESLIEFIYAGETVVKTENVDDLVAIQGRKWKMSPKKYIVWEVYFCP